MQAQADKQQNGRIVYLDLMRVAATFIVIMLHISSSRFDTLDPASFQWKIQNIYDGFSRWGVGVFVMISGALFLKADIPIGKLYRKYILRIIIAMAFWTLFYSAIYVVAGKNSLYDCLTRFNEVCYHLWFLLMITGLYMIVPFLRRIAEQETLMKYYLILGLVFAFFIPEATSVLKIVSPTYGASVQKIISQLHFHFVLGYSAYFLLGYYLSSHTIRPAVRRIIYCLGVIGFAVTMLGNIPLAQYKKESVEVFFSNNTVNVLLEGMSVFVLMKSLFSRASFGGTATRLITALSKCSFGAYLVHVAVISMFNKVLNLNAFSFNPVVSIPVTTILVFAVSFAISAVLNRIPVVRKYLV